MKKFVLLPYDLYSRSYNTHSKNETSKETTVSPIDDSEEKSITSSINDKKREILPKDQKPIGDNEKYHMYTSVPPKKKPLQQKFRKHWGEKDEKSNTSGKDMIYTSASLKEKSTPKNKKINKHLKKRLPKPKDSLSNNVTDEGFSWLLK